SERGLGRVRCAKRFTSSVFRSRRRTTNITTTRSTSAKFKSSSSGVSVARSCSMSGSKCDGDGAATRSYKCPECPNSDSRNHNSVACPISRSRVNSVWLLRLPSRPTFGFFQVNTLEDQTELCGFERFHHRAVRSGNSVAPLLETLRPHRNPVSIPIHDAHAVHASREEDEEVTAEDIYPETLAHQNKQTVGTLAPIDGLRGHEQLNAWR